MSDRPQPIWDIPVRVFHWSLLLLIAAAWISVELDRMQVHEYCGLAIITLLAARIVWGFVGSRNARFTSFLRGPATVMRYWRGEYRHIEGHNPAGGWSVLAMLLLVAVQAATGLFNADDVSFRGPLAHTVRKATVDALGEWHEINFNLLLAMVAVHVGAVFYYLLNRGENLVRPMLTGGRSSGGARPRPAWLALLILLSCGALLWWLLSLVPPPKIFL